MQTRTLRQLKRFKLILVAGGILVAAAALVLFALQEQIVYFNTPTDIQTGKVELGQHVRVGGMVVDGSVTKNGTQVLFSVTDNENSIDTIFSGVLPDLFREGQGVVMEGSLTPENIFEAKTVLAKHDENYVPKEVMEAMKEQGTWKGADEYNANRPNS